jgi:hypothetical protein
MNHRRRVYCSLSRCRQQQDGTGGPMDARPMRDRRPMQGKSAPSPQQGRLKKNDSGTVTPSVAGSSQLDQPSRFSS